jgi:hypothetical protein
LNTSEVGFAGTGGRSLGDPPKIVGRGGATPEVLNVVAHGGLEPVLLHGPEVQHQDPTHVRRYPLSASFR